jgi:hypothetical protein
MVPKPLHFAFREATGCEVHCGRLEVLVDCGIVPDEFKQQAGVTLAEALAEYQGCGAALRRELLDLQTRRIGTARTSTVDYGWVEKWVAKVKRVRRWEMRYCLT